MIEAKGKINDQIMIILIYLEALHSYLDPKLVDIFNL